MSASLTSNDPVRIFFSYSTKDDELRKELISSLKVLERQGLISLWDDSSIEAGQEWEKEIIGTLYAVGIFAALISPDYLASYWATSIEMPRALERNKIERTRIIPIILRPCDWLQT